MVYLEALEILSQDCNNKVNHLIIYVRHVTLQIESLCSADDTLKEKLEVLCQYFSIEEEEEDEEEEKQFNHISSLLNDFDERIKLDQLLKVSYNYKYYY